MKKIQTSEKRNNFPKKDTFWEKKETKPPKKDTKRHDSIKKDTPLTMDCAQILILKGFSWFSLFFGFFFGKNMGMCVHPREFLILSERVLIGCLIYIYKYNIYNNPYPCSFSRFKDSPPSSLFLFFLVLCLF